LFAEWSNLMSSFEPQDPTFAARIATSYARQTVLQLIGAKLGTVMPGVVEISLPFRTDLCQQHGFIHAGIVTTIADTACGYAAMTFSPADASVLSVEFKINLLSPAVGARLRARGEVKRAGRTISVCAGDVWAEDAVGNTKLVATMLATMMTIRERPGVVELSDRDESTS
jgi:uncharacterized protein (TIGR00369 family)